MFPKNINDPFYQQFDDPHRAYSNLPALYSAYLVEPCDKRHDLDHVTYARALAAQHRVQFTEGGRALISKKVLLAAFGN